MGTPRIVYDDVPTRRHYAFDGSIEVNQYDLMFHDSNDVKPASSQADAGTEDKNQRTFARLFAGLAGDSRKSTDTGAVASFPVLTDVVVEMDCVSATFEVGDLVTIDEADSGTALEDQKLAKTTDASKAIGYCVKREGSATTRVQARLIGRNGGNAPANQRSALNGGSANTETLAANKTLVVGDAPIQVLDPGGAGRDVTLPAEADSVGLSFIIRNAADAAEVLTIKDDGAATVCTPTQNETAIVFCDGTTWRGMVAAHN